MKRFAFTLAVTFLFLAILPQQQPAIAKDTWTSVQSKNFYLIGNGSEKEIRQVAVRLEQFREVFTHLFPKITFTTPVPTTVVVFKSDSSFKPFKPGPNIAGYFQPGPDVNYISLTTELQGTQDPFTVIFHEYVHLLVNNTLGNAPLWFNEGLAEYYSTFSISNDQKVVLGNPIGNHVYLLRQNKMLPLRTLFQVDHKSPHYNERNKQSIFYAESWALMHYLIIGKAGRVAQLGTFIQKIIQNVPMEQAFQEAFEMSFEAMEKELREYVRQDRYNIVSGHFERKLETDTEMRSAPVSEAEAQAYLGDLLLHSNRKDSETYLEKALALDPNSAMANAAMGMAKLRDGKPSDALMNLERAVTANSQNYLVHYYYAYALSQHTTGASQTISAYAPEVAAKIRQELLKAIELRRDYPESYNLLSFVSLVTGNNLDEAVTLLTRALKISPGRNDLVFMLGQLYARTGDYKRAVQLLEQVTKSNAAEELRQRAQNVLTQFASFQKQQEQYEQARKSPGIGDTATEVTTNNSVAVTTEQQVSPQSDASSYLREVLRKPGAGETQLQGTLLRIECDAKGIVFVVKTADQTLRLHTPNFEQIEITTYNPDIKGDITCGVRKAEESIVVCFIRQSDKRLKRDGVLKSVEFVPASFKLTPTDKN
jgi:tetratricopeptide (TPR) repeat protein